MILLLQYTLIFASVLLLVALGGCFSEHSGIINIGLEGIMVLGALGGALTMKFLPADTPALAMVLLVILASMALGVIFSLLLAVAAVNFNADQTLVGTAMNLLGVAAATVFVKAMNTAESVAGSTSTGSCWWPSSPWCCPTSSSTRPVSACACAPAASIPRRRTRWASTSTRCATPVS